jgi:hypothetical protein
MTAPVGDVNSEEMGSGARWNAGKVPFDMLPLKLLVEFMIPRSEYHEADELLTYMGHWQAGDDSALDDALAFTAEIMKLHHLHAFAECANVFQHVTTRPVKPYPKWNWTKGMSWSVPLGCIVRHALAWRSGEAYDPETNFLHLAHIQCNLLMLKLYQKTYTEGDDRPPKGRF